MTGRPPLHLWLPALTQFQSAHPLCMWLARADRQPDGACGYLAGLGDYFTGVDASLPAAALTREHLAGDAGDASWLSADPAWVQPDLNGARLLACGRMQLSMAEALALAEPLQPLCDEAGMQLQVTMPDRWHLRLPPATSLPAFAPPEQAMGEDLSQHLPAGAEGQRWRILLNDIQVTLHQHPLNTDRRGRRLPPVNSLWLWGGGQLPGPLHSNLRGAISDEPLLQALVRHVGLAARERSPASVASADAGWLIDLQDLPAAEIELQWWPTLQGLLRRQSVALHFASGERWLHRRWHRGRIWRRARP